MWPYVVWMLIVVSLIYRGYAKKAAHAQRATQAAEVRGAQGEADVGAALDVLLTEMCGKNFVLRLSVILQIARGTKYPTAEIDHLAITPFGVFVIETKAWRGQIKAGPSDDSLTWISPAGATEVRKNPLTQNRSKVAFIHRLLPGELFGVMGVGVFSNSDTRVSPGLPLDLVGIGDLRHWLRGKLKSWHSRTENLAVPTFVDVAKIDSAIMKFVDASPGAAARHKACVTAISGTAL
jgi:hypothetical protein